MENKIRFFDETFKALLAVMVSAWVLYVILIFFIGDNDNCVPPGFPTGVFVGGAYVVAIASVLPIVYGLVRVLFWPNGPKSRSTYIAGWVMSGLASLFVGAVILFAFLLSQFGCQ